MVLMADQVVLGVEEHQMEVVAEGHHLEGEVVVGLQDLAGADGLRDLEVVVGVDLQFQVVVEVEAVLPYPQVGEVEGVSYLHLEEEEVEEVLLQVL